MSRIEIAYHGGEDQWGVGLFAKRLEEALRALGFDVKLSYVTESVWIPSGQHFHVAVAVEGLWNESRPHVSEWKPRWPWTKPAQLIMAVPIVYICNEQEVREKFHGDVQVIARVIASEACRYDPVDTFLEGLAVLEAAH